MALLRVQSGPKSGTLINVETGNFTIGRGEKAGFRLSDQGSSRQHAEIFRMGELYFIRDLQSRNGTFVNDRRVNEVILREGDQIRIGDTSLLFLEREGSAQSRNLRLQEGGSADGIRFRDTIVELKPITTTQPKKESFRALTRRVSQIIAAGDSNLKGVFERVIREVGQALGADRADILLIDSLKPEVRYRTVATFDTKGEGEVGVSRTIVTEALERREAVMSSDAALDQRFDEAASIITHPVHSVLCVPMLAAGSAAGVVYLSSQRSEVFDKDQLELAAQVGLQLSGLLGMLKLFESREEVLETAVLLAVGAFANGKNGNGGAPGRAETVARYAREIAHALNLPAEEAARAWAAGALHALGKEGVRLPSGGPGAELILEAVRCQDERHDGHGSPNGRIGEEIPVLGRILAFAKELDRRVRGGAGEGPGGEAQRGEAQSLDEALAGLRGTAGAEFDPDVVQACLVAQRNGALAGEREPFKL